jgi:hypothetical protein
MTPDSEIRKTSEESCVGERGRELRVRLRAAEKARFKIATLVGATIVVILLVNRCSSAIATQAPSARSISVAAFRAAPTTWSML